MRIPPVHFVTKGYFRRFNIETYKWTNYNPNAYLYIYGQMIKNEDWRTNGKARSTEFFPGWDSQLLTLKRSEWENINGIEDYFTKTVGPLVIDLCDNLRRYPDSGWDRWVRKWSVLSIEEFLRTDKYQDPKAVKYRPWPEAAVEGFQISRYMYPMERSVVEYLRFVIGDWWPEVLEAPIEGMSILPEKFTEKYAHKETNVDLSKRLVYGIKVEKIHEIPGNGVKVSGTNVKNGSLESFTADAVIVTVPLTILRQLDISVQSFGLEYQKAVANVNYVAITKVIIQCRTRFWEKDIGDGGSTTTTLPIGQLYYLKSSNLNTERGLLLCYAWGQDALILGSQTDEEAIDAAVEQISKIHPEIKDEFEFGIIQAWHRDPASQGAFAQMLPHQYNDVMKILTTPTHPMYLAGEALSYLHSWIQGALETGLNAAYNLFCHDLE